MERKTHNEIQLIHMFELTYEEEIDNKDSNFEIIDEQSTQEFDK
jgi:hypothetical protein